MIHLHLISFHRILINLFPQTDRDTPISDPDPAVSYARSIPIGEVIVDDVKKSITRETIDKLLKDVDVGIGLTNLQTDLETQAHTFQTKIDHGLNRVVNVSIASSGDGYGTGANADYYNAKLVGIGTSTTGSHATAKVSVDATGGITDVTIMDGGSAYGIGKHNARCWNSNNNNCWNLHASCGSSHRNL